MKSCWFFLQKEIAEHIRTWRLLILSAVFLLFGMISPATAKFTPEILKMAGADSGMVIQMPPVIVTDSYLQFFKNMNSMGVIVILLVFAGIVVGEKVKGSAQLILTKNISRWAFVLAKYLGGALLWTVVYAAGALVCWCYALWFFPGESAAHLPVAFAAYWLYGLLLLAFTVLASAAARGQGLATLGAFAGWGALLLSMVPPQLAKVSPAVLGSANLAVILSAMPVGDLLVPALLAVALIALSLGGAILALSRQEL